MNIKLLVVYHEQATLLKDNVLTPINAGRALQKLKKNLDWLRNNTIADDTGDNISNKNKTYNEMTAVYWAWKHQEELGNPDAIGLQHYRRHLVLNEKYIPKGDRWTVDFDSYQGGLDSYLKKIGYSEESIKRLCTDYPCVVGYCHTENMTVREHYKCAEKYDHHHYCDLEFCEKYIEEKFPQYVKAMQTYLDGKDQYFGNVFILRKDLFNRYCEFVFDVLEAFEQQLDTKERSAWESRFFISERLTGIFITSLMLDKFEVKKLYISYVKNVKPFTSPKVTNDAVNLCFATDERYLKYLGVALVSIAEHMSSNRDYKAYILHKGIDQDAINKFKLNFIKYKNLEPIFIDITSLLDELDLRKFYIEIHVTLSTYYRFFIQQIFKGFDKILYLDSDLCVLDDIAKLYDSKLDNALIGAVIDVRENYAIKKNFVVSAKKIPWRNYVEDTLGIKKIGTYFQAGVLLFNLQEFGSVNLLDRCLSKLSEIKTPILSDQDVLNSEFTNKIKYLDGAWNIEWQIPFECPDYKRDMPSFLYSIYFNARSNPKIIHYASSIKPWFGPQYENAYLWWNYARMVNYYEEFILDLGGNVAEYVHSRKDYRARKRLFFRKHNHSFIWHLAHFKF